ncbi:MAG TPA: hypothetical protein VF032_17820 [Thermoleophilaceae bacterium]
MTRLSRTAIAAGAAALATGAALATNGSAQAPAGTSLHLVSKQAKHGAFFPKHGLRNGDRFGFVDRISGDDSGSSRIVCTAVGDRALCTIQVQLSKGTLSAQGVVPQRANNTPVAITGGTGAYNGARGTAFTTDTSSTSSKIDIQLLP